MFRWLRLLSSRATARLSKERRGASPALAALARGDYRMAETLLTDAIEAAHTPGRQAFFLNKRGVARVNLGRKDEARADFEGALQRVQRYAPALTNLANLLLEEGRVDDAIASYRCAIDADAEYAVAYVNLGAAYKRAGRLSEAVAALRTGVRLEGRKRSRPTRDA
jgi:tetratricopeptide (TPR) repeat protein